MSIPNQNETQITFIQSSLEYFVLIEINMCSSDRKNIFIIELLLAFSSIIIQKRPPYIKQDDDPISKLSVRVGWQEQQISSIRENAKKEPGSFFEFWQFESRNSCLSLVFFYLSANSPIFRLLSSNSNVIFFRNYFPLLFYSNF